MASPLRPPPVALALAFALACGDDGDTGMTDASTTGATASATTDTTTTDTTTTASTTDTTTTTATTTTTTTDATTDDATTDDATTGVDISGFERFLMSTAAGPCPPGDDCDGFIELLAGGTLRVEVFGDVNNDVIVVQIPDAEYQAAAQVFADPALLALLDGPDPLCNPPTDIFESMLVEVDGAPHEATTTTCSQPEIATARAMAQGLRDTYVP